MKCQIPPLDVARNAHSVTIYRSFPRILVFLHTLKVKVPLLRECHALRNDLRNAACCIIENVINRRLITELMRK